MNTYNKLVYNKLIKIKFRFKSSYFEFLMHLTKYSCSKVNMVFLNEIQNQIVMWDFRVEVYYGIPDEDFINHFLQNFPMVSCAEFYFKILWCFVKFQYLECSRRIFSYYFSQIFFTGIQVKILTFQKYNNRKQYYNR